MQNEIMYYQENDDVEYIYYKNATQSYPMHTHANHITMGYIMDGLVLITCNGQECILHKGEAFCIMPDILHAVTPVNDMTYSMVSVCVPVDGMMNEEENENNYSMRLKQIISGTPEDTLLIDDMAQSIGISPYHMIRQFKNTCGLTPHQFQIQCRVRKAQKLLEKGKSVTEVTYATGFCDQSHFDRCFRKIVRLTPSEYRLAVKRLV